MFKPKKGEYQHNFWRLYQIFL